MAVHGLLSQVKSLVRQQGPGELGRRVIRRAYQASGAAALEVPILAADIADSARLDLPEVVHRPAAATPLTVAWICTPPSAGSGGHTTMFRMVQALEAAGHRCVIYLYDRYGGDVARHERVIRGSWPTVRAEVKAAGALIGGLDVCVATSWQTAHLLASRSELRSRRCYFIQDYEPFFFARGTEYELAADTYRFGFRNIALGRMVADCLRDQVGVTSRQVPFGCDTEVYRRSNDGPRSGIVFYTKPDVSRRGYLLGRLALTEFHRRHPEHQIHVYGEEVRDLDFPVVQHHRLTPAELNSLYNQVIGGLALSFTNISLVAEEMLASGVIPVVNDSEHSRADLPNELVSWARPNPTAVADALCRLVEHADPIRRSRAAAASVAQDGWRDAGRMLVTIIEEEAYGVTGS